MATHLRLGPLAALILLAVSLGGCGSYNTFGSTAQLGEHECLARVMYFESNRSSDDGMLAVGTVVMNRLQSPKYPKSICGVVGQTNQFAEGALTKPVLRRSASWTRAERVASAVLAGERHGGVRDGKFFHTAGYTFPYRNMHYLTLAGGNAFYEKKTPGTFTPGLPWENRTTVADARPLRASEPTAVAERAETPRPVQLASAAAADEEDAPAMPAPLRAASVDRAGEADREVEVEPIVRRPRPVVAEAPLRPFSPRPEPFSPGFGRSPAPRPVAIAAAPPVRTLRPVTLAAADPPVRTLRPVTLAATEPPVRPKAIVVAMLSEPKGRPARAPRSIEDLIAMDLQQR